VPTLHAMSVEEGRDVRGGRIIMGVGKHKPDAYNKGWDKMYMGISHHMPTIYGVLMTNTGTADSRCIGVVRGRWGDDICTRRLSSACEWQRQ